MVEFRNHLIDVLVAHGLITISSQVIALVAFTIYLCIIIYLFFKILFYFSDLYEKRSEYNNKNIIILIITFIGFCSYSFCKLLNYTYFGSFKRPLKDYESEQQIKKEELNGKIIKDKYGNIIVKIRFYHKKNTG